MRITNLDDLGKALDAGELLDVSEDAQDAMWSAEVMMTAQAHAALVGDASGLADEAGREVLWSTMRAAMTAIADDPGVTRVPFVVAVEDRGSLELVALLTRLDEEAVVVVALDPDECAGCGRAPEVGGLCQSCSLDRLGDGLVPLRFPTCATCGEADVEDAGDHADRAGHWPTSVGE